MSCCSLLFNHTYGIRAILEQKTAIFFSKTEFRADLTVFFSYACFLDAQIMNKMDEHRFAKHRI